MDPVPRVTQEPAAVPDRSKRHGARKGKRFHLAGAEHRPRAQRVDRARSRGERPLGPMLDDESGGRVDVVA